MLLYFVVGLINIFSQHHNYGIKIEDPNFDIRVRRSVEDTAKPQVFSTNNNVKHYLKTDVLNAIRVRKSIEDTAKQQDFNIHGNNLKTDVLKRKKRYASYKKTTITNNDLYRLNNTQENKNNGSQTRNGNRYDIFNPNWNFLINTTRNNSNNSGVNNGIIYNNNRPIIRSYPYGYPPGYGPKTNTATENYGIPTTPGYRNQYNNNNSPYYYNYQNPDGQNFAGYVGYTANTSGFNSFAPGYNSIPVPYAPRPKNTGNNNNAPWTNPLAPYPPNYTQNPVPATTNNNFPFANNNTGIHNLPYAPTNGVYNNNYNSKPAPFNKDYLSPYAPNFNNGSATPNNTFVPYSPVNNTFVPYSPVNNTFVPYFPVNNTFVPYSPVNNTYVTTPSNLNSTGTTTEKMIIAAGCVICNIPCPQFMRRFGRFCVADYEE